MKHFWKRWMREWLPSLNSRKKWTRKTKNFVVGDIVLLVTPNSPRSHWPLGRIIEVHPGSDGLVRVVKVKCKQQELIRSVTRLCLLEGI